MQSKFFFTLLFLYFGGVIVLAQDRADVSLEYTEGSGVKGELWLSTSLKDSLLELVLHGATVEEVRLSQGRLKEALEFQYVADTLKVTVPANLDPRSRFYISYSYSWEALKASPYVELLNPGFVLNAFNLEEGARSGIPGWILPSRSGSFDELQVGLLHPEGLNPGIPLKEDYEVELEDGKKLLFFRSQGPVDLYAFYLVFGQFRRFDPEDLLDDLAENEELLAKSRLAQFESNYESILSFVSRRYGLILTTQKLEELAELEPLVAPMGFWNEGLEKKQNRNIQNKSYAILAQFEEEEELFETWLLYCKSQIGKENWSLNLESHYKEGDTNALFWSYLMEDYIEGKGLQWADTSRRDLKEQDQFYFDIARSALQRRASVEFKVAYRIKSNPKRMEFYFSQGDTTVSIKGLLDLSLVLKDSLVQSRVPFNLGTADTAVLPLRESPRSLYIKDYNDPFLTFEEQRPLTYWLYDLSKAPSDLQKRKALLELLQLANPNLLATVIGVALDSGEPELQHLALSKVKDLRPDGRRRLESTLRAMAQDQSNVKLMQKAQSLVKEYWPE